MKIRHIYWFAHYNLDCASVRYRGKYPLEYLQEKHGISYSLVVPGYQPAVFLQFLRVFFACFFFRKRHSVIVIQKVISDRFYGKALKWLIRKSPHHTIYDIDDAEYLRNPIGSMHFFMKKCAKITVGSEALADYCRKFNAQVEVLTSPVLAHGLHKQGFDFPLTIGWVGDYGNGNAASRDFAHKRSLQEILFPALKQLDFPFRMVLLGVKRKEDIPEIRAYFQDVPHIELVIPEIADWRDEPAIYSWIQTFDIGVSPLVNHPFNAAKSAFKLKQYMSCGVPVLVSPVGENEGFLVDGIQGFFCATPEDFASKISFLNALGAPELTRMGAEALATAGNYSIEKFCWEWLSMQGSMPLHNPAPKWGSALENQPKPPKIPVISAK